MRVVPSAAGNVLEIAVADTGIAPDRLPHIMNPFTEESRNPYTSDRGWGLGLSISKSLIDLHDGEVIIQSRLGHGITVTVRLLLDHPAVAKGGNGSGLGFSLGENPDFG